MWLPNVGAPIRVQYLYAVFEAFHPDLPKENRIRSYVDFLHFFSSLLELIPSFPYIEDYVTHPDWGHTKYFFRNKFYRIFNGTDLSSTYDFLYSFETIHAAFDDSYRNLISRSALEELDFILTFQDYIINNLTQSTTLKIEISPGDLSVPSEEFWSKANLFLSQFRPAAFLAPNILARYSFDVRDLGKSKFPNIEKFRNQAFEGKNCQYFLIKSGDQYYPVLPRKFTSTLIDFWGDILKKNYSRIQAGLPEPHIKIAIQSENFYVGELERTGCFLPSAQWALMVRDTL